MGLFRIFERRGAKLQDPQSGDEFRQRVDTLTPREREAYNLLLEGYTMRYCAEQMGVKYPTVNTYTTAIYKKLGVSSRTELIIRYRGVR